MVLHGCRIPLVWKCPILTTHLIYSHNIPLLYINPLFLIGLVTSRTNIATYIQGMVRRPRVLHIADCFVAFLSSFINHFWYYPIGANDNFRLGNDILINLLSANILKHDMTPFSHPNTTCYIIEFSCNEVIQDIILIVLNLTISKEHITESFLKSKRTATHIHVRTSTLVMK